MLLSGILIGMFAIPSALVWKTIVIYIIEFEYEPHHCSPVSQSQSID